MYTYIPIWKFESKRISIFSDAITIWKKKTIENAKTILRHENVEKLLKTSKKSCPMNKEDFFLVLNELLIFLNMFEFLHNFLTIMKKLFSKEIRGYNLLINCWFNHPKNSFDFL